MTTREDLQRVARTYIGTPYVHQARTPGRGLDCAGILIALARELDLHFPDRKGYSRQADGVTLRAELDDRLDPIDAAEPGDVLLLWIRRPAKPQHVALLTDYGILHSYADVGRVVETVMDEWWRARIVQAYRFRGVA